MDLSSKKIKILISNIFGSIDSGTIYTNDHVDIVHKACRICVGKEPATDTEDQLSSIEKVISRGHESVLEHSNIIMFIIVPQKDIMALLEVTEHFKYLNYKTVVEDTNIKMLIGGSIRGYKHVFRNIKNLNNVILESIKQELYIAANKEYFMDFIEDGIMDYNQFKRERVAEVDQETGDLVSEEYTSYITKDKYPEHKTFKIINIDDIEYVYSVVHDLGFTYDDLLDLCTISILFKNIGRIISQQFTRHRAGISQESQRYVDYSKAKFINPAQFKPNNYNLTYKYTIKIADQTYDLNLDELADLMLTIYPQLREQGLAKEDARGFTLLNIETKFMMTFTIRGFIKFLELRTDKSAQAEIQETGLAAELLFKDHAEPIIGEIYKYLLPKYKLQEADYDYSKIDEAMDDIIEGESDIDEPIYTLSKETLEGFNRCDSKESPDNELKSKGLEEY